MSFTSSSRRSSLMDHQQQHSNNHHHYQQQHYSYPSFSSSLLEEIYRSFDEDQREDHSHYDDDNNNNNNNNYKKMRMINKSCSSSSSSSYMERQNGDDTTTDRFRVNRFVLDEWMENEKKINNLRRSSTTENKITSSSIFNSSSSTSSSSDSASSGICGFSSSDTESWKSKSNSEASSTLKPIKTTINQPEFQRKSYEIPAKKKSNNNKETNLQKRALKLYGDLKKVKQPISPGGKLASFLNSLFNSTTSKKPKISSSTSSSSSSFPKLSASTPSTASSSSYSRSCLSKTPSSAGRFERRSVRFCPVNTVIAAETAENEEREDWRREKEELKVQIMEKQHRRVEEVAKELLKNYQHGKKYYQHKVGNNNIRPRNKYEVEYEDEDEDDDGSCCSSDLFELENLLEIGVDRRYREELPVYETTHVDKNRAIAKGFIL